MYDRLRGFITIFRRYLWLMKSLVQRSRAIYEKKKHLTDGPVDTLHILGSP